MSRWSEKSPSPFGPSAQSSAFEVTFVEPAHPKTLIALRSDFGIKFE
jgi:hypothetical protein